MRARLILFAAPAFLAAVLAAPLAAAPPSTVGAAAGATPGDSLADLEAKAARGDKTAAAAACAHLYNADHVRFDPKAAFAACRHAADLGSADAFNRIGTMTLAGVGAARDLAIAASLCRTSSQLDPAGPGGFCITAVRAEARRATGAIPDDAAAQPPPASLDAAAIDRLQAAAERGDHNALGQLCGLYFNAPLGAFDPGRTADWCRRAAGFGDSDAMRRLGLMRFWGVGMERSIAGANALCTEAQARDPAVGGGFCLAAVKAEQLRTAEAAAPARYAYPQPWSVAQEMGALPNPLSADRVLETVRETPGGLQYSCHDLTRWARYGVPLNPSTFGRPLAEFVPADYTELAASASECESLITPFDLDGSQRRLLAAFRDMLPTLQARQAALIATQRQQLEESQQASTQSAAQRRDFTLLVAMMSDPQARCVEAMRRDWLAGGISRGAQAMEIRSIATQTTDGNTVVVGGARVIPQIYQDRFTPMAFTCTFDGPSQRLVATSVRPTGPSVSSQFASP